MCFKRKHEPIRLQKKEENEKKKKKKKKNKIHEDVIKIKRILDNTNSNYNIYNCNYLCNKRKY